MANQFGNFAGSFADSFTRALALKEQSKRSNELAKQQAKVFEQQLALNQGRIDAAATFADIMTGTVGEIEGVRDISELGEPGPLQGGRREVPDLNFTGEEPLDVADILSGKTPRAKQGQQAALQAGFLKGGDIADFQSEQNRLAAVPSIESLIGPQDGDGQPAFRIGGISVGQNGPEISLIPNPELKTDLEKRFSIESLNLNVEDGFQLAKLESQLKGTFVESGTPLTEIARAGKSAVGLFGGMFGMEFAEGEDADVIAADLRGKIFGMVKQRRIADAIKQNKGRPPSVFQLEQIEEISPSDDKSPEANIQLYGRFLKEELANAIIEGDTIPAALQKRFAEFIRMAESGEFFQGDESEPVVDGPGALDQASEAFGRFKDFTIEQINNIDPSTITNLVDLDAFEAKAKQLKEQASDIDLPNITVPDVVKMNFEQLKQTDFSGMAEDVKNAAIERYQKLAEVSAPFIESALGKVKSGIATARDFAELTIEEIKQIDEEDIKAWTEEQKAAFNKRRKELGL